MPNFSHSLALEPNKPQDLEFDASEWLADQVLSLDEDLDMHTLFQALFTGYDLRFFAQALSKLEDGLPLPQIFEWQSFSVSRLLDDPELLPADRRTLNAFQQIVEMERKSEKYFAAIQALFQRQPDQELATQILNYLARWYPEQVESWTQAQLAAHPDWQTLRFLSASHCFKPYLPYPIPEPVQQKYAALLQNKYELHEFFPDQEVNAQAVLLFYEIQALWLISNEIHLLRALYAINVCLEIESEMAEKTPDHEDDDEPFSDFLIEFWLSKVMDNNDEQAISSFVEKLRKKA